MRLLLGVATIGMPTPGCCRSIASPDVFRMRDKFEMFRPNAVSMHTTAIFNVIPLKALGRTSHQEVVSQAYTPFEVKFAVPILHDGPEPQGAAIGTARVDFRPKTIVGESRSVGLENTERAPTSTPTHVMRLAPTARIHRARAIGNATLRRHRELIPSGVTRPDVSASRPLPILRELNLKRGALCPM